MLIKRCIAIFLCLLLLTSFAACHAKTPDSEPIGSTQPPIVDSTDPTDPTDSTSPPKVIHITQDGELRAIEAYLNDQANNGFISNNYYTSPEKIDLKKVFYDGAGIKQASSLWAEGEKQAVLSATGWQAYNPLTKIPREAANSFLLEKCGLSLDDFQGAIPDFKYVEAYDAFYHAHEDLNYRRVTVLSAQIDKKGQHIVYYSIPCYTAPDYTQRPANYTVTLLKTDSGYQFISNVENIAPLPPGIEDPFLSVLTGRKSFYSITKNEILYISYYRRFVIPYVLIDIDSDGKREVVISWNYFADDKPLLILQEENGSVTGFDLKIPDLIEFNSDGSFDWGTFTGTVHTTGRSILQFSGDHYTTIELWREERSTSGSVAYYVDNKPVSKEEYSDARKHAAYWVTYTQFILD